jgi:hypothetical protein
VQNKEDAEKICILLFQVFPRLNELQLNEFLHPDKSCLPFLLPYTSPLQQQALSLQLALWFSRHVNPQNLFDFSLQAMHFFAKAIQIGNHCKELGDTYRFASQLFMPIIRQQLIQGSVFQRALESLSRDARDDHHAFQMASTTPAQTWSS